MSSDTSVSVEVTNRMHSPHIDNGELEAMPQGQIDTTSFDSSVQILSYPLPLLERQAK